MADFEAANPEQDIFGDVGGVVGDAFEMAGGEDVVEIGSGERRIRGHAREQRFENLVTILVHDIIAFEHLGGQIHVLVDKSAETFGNHGADGSDHWLELGRDVDFAHLGEGDGAFAEVDGEIAHALEVVIDFQGGDDEADVSIEHFALAEHADGVLVNQDFHFVDARLGEEDLAGETFVAFEQGPKSAIDRGLDRAGLGD